MGNYSQQRKEFKNKKTTQRLDHLNQEANKALRDVCSKRFQTVFVGAVSKIESFFGPLWGNDDVSEDEMSPQQLIWYKKFLDLRDEIFDQGNDQRKKFLKELSVYNIKYKGYENGK